MADIERWITVNGVHIPIMKGESKARAVGRFIKDKRARQKAKLRKEAEALDKPYFEARRNETDPKKFFRLEQERDAAYAKASERQKIKGYSADPYNRVNKAQTARLKASREHQWDKDQAYGLLRTIREDGSKTLDSRLNDLYRKEKPNASRLEKSKLRFEAQRLRNEYDAKLSDAEARYKNAQVKQSKAMDAATAREFNKEYKGYKLSNKYNTNKETVDILNAVRRFSDKDISDLIKSYSSEGAIRKYGFKTKASRDEMIKILKDEQKRRK